MSDDRETVRLQVAVAPESITVQERIPASTPAASGSGPLFRAADYQIFPDTARDWTRASQETPPAFLRPQARPLHLRVRIRHRPEPLSVQDGAPISASSNGVARSDLGPDFIHEMQVQSIGASVEYGQLQGAVVNVITKSGGNVFQYRRRVLRAALEPDEPAEATLSTDRRRGQRL